jgi:hypothetical protein
VSIIKIYGVWLISKGKLMVEKKSFLQMYVVSFRCQIIEMSYLVFMPGC